MIHYTMKQEVVFERPQQGDYSIPDVAAAEMVQVTSLLEGAEQEAVIKRGVMICVAYDGKNWMVPGHGMVPSGSTAVRASSGHLVGIAAVTGG